LYAEFYGIALIQYRAQLPKLLKPHSCF